MPPMPVPYVHPCTREAGSRESTIASVATDAATLAPDSNPRDTGMVGRIRSSITALRELPSRKFVAYRTIIADSHN
jgi:hypothetical protein